MSGSTPTAACAADAVDQAALLQGDAHEFEKLVRCESGRLYQVLLRYVRDEDEVRSLVQETFLQAFQRLHTFRGESKITTWVYGIGINLARASLRKSRREDVLDEEGIERLQPAFRMGMYASGFSAWNPEARVSRDERRRIVRGAIERLPEPYRVIITLRDMEGFSTEEVAGMLEVKVGAARVRLHRARQALRALLEPYFGKTQ